jgi:putative transposase
MLIAAKLNHQRWGPKKIVAWLTERHAGRRWPAISTVGEILRREGLVRHRKRRRSTPAYTEPFLECCEPNKVWSADYKGQFRTKDGRLCYPLTITDNKSRYVLECRGLYHPSYEETWHWFENTFSEHGLPDAIRTDNGLPFASTALGGLTKLSVWFTWNPA